MLWLIPFAVALCIALPPLVARALKNRRDKRADQDFCGWYDTGPDLPIPDAGSVVISKGN
jgi:hypothetical protein